MTGVQTCALPICFPVTIKLLDKGERWIGGEKFKGSDYKGIEKALEWQRKLNKIAGFSSDKKNWQQYEYENQMRELKND